MGTSKERYHRSQNSSEVAKLTSQSSHTRYIPRVLSSQQKRKLRMSCAKRMKEP